ncbi:CPBP family intramembrane metalloprotease [Candidatus Sumerlaeota bacterium]|nr:CPBP family intramembrane metalloprotease [Candidatus Sumerlaeota bacterium]
MVSLPDLFWAVVLCSLFLALWDCGRSPLGTTEALRRFTPAGVVLLLLVVGFVAVNLARFGWAEAAYLFGAASQFGVIILGSIIFFCGGWPIVERAGCVGLFGRVRRRIDGTQGPSAARAAAETLLVAAGVILLSWRVFVIARSLGVNVQPSQAFERWFLKPDSMDKRSGYAMLLILLAPVWEETTFRWYILNRLEEALRGWRWKRLVAVVASSALWACGHAALTEPFWVKMVQIFIVGCLLSWRFRVIGLSGCIIAHMAMNVTVLFTLLWFRL